MSKLYDLIRTKYLENLLKDSCLSQYSIAKILFIPGSQRFLKTLFFGSPPNHESIGASPSHRLFRQAASFILRVAASWEKPVINVSWILVTDILDTRGNGVREPNCFLRETRKSPDDGVCTMGRMGRNQSVEYLAIRLSARSFSLIDLLRTALLSSHCLPHCCAHMHQNSDRGFRFFLRSW